MGQVFRATDTKLKRQVAIKILPPSLAADHDRLARFQREAEVLASLNHPNIAHIHGLEESGGITALVMEFVDGEDLSRRIARGAIPLDEALPIAKQIAEALEAAHEQGIIHRDLKPANIKVREDGTVKALDFGLAKAMEADGFSHRQAEAQASAPQTITSPAMTQAGMILWIDNGRCRTAAASSRGGAAITGRSTIAVAGACSRRLSTLQPPSPCSINPLRSLRTTTSSAPVPASRTTTFTPNGRFIMIRRGVNGGKLSLIINWTDELKQILASGGVQ